jgi:hypothetical protein
VKKIHVGWEKKLSFFFAPSISARTPCKFSERTAKLIEYKMYIQTLPYSDCLEGNHRVTEWSPQFTFYVVNLILIFFCFQGGEKDTWWCEKKLSFFFAPSISACAPCKFSERTAKLIEYKMYLQTLPYSDCLESNRRVIEWSPQFIFYVVNLIKI